MLIFFKTHKKNFYANQGTTRSNPFAGVRILKKADYT